MPGHGGIRTYNLWNTSVTGVVGERWMGTPGKMATVAQKIEKWLL